MNTLLFVELFVEKRNENQSHATSPFARLSCCFWKHKCVYVAFRLRGGSPVGEGGWMSSWLFVWCSARVAQRMCNSNHCIRMYRYSSMYNVCMYVVCMCVLWVEPTNNGDSVATLQFKTHTTHLVLQHNLTPKLLIS